MYKILEAAITRSRTTLLILFMILLAGVMSRSAIPVEGDPEINVPFFVVTVVHEGISPEDAERLLVMPLEIELRQVEGVEELTAYASEGAATLMVEFDADYDLDQAICYPVTTATLLQPKKRQSQAFRQKNRPNR